MNKNYIFYAISVSVFVFFFILGFICVSEPVYSQPKYNDPAYVKGLGVIEIDAKYTTYRDVTRTRQRWVPGHVYAPSGGPVSGRSGHAETEYYTTREAVEDDYNLSFIILENGEEIFRGVTPVRVINFDPGITYTIIWIGASGIRKEGTFSITTIKPFTRYIHIE